MQFWDDACAGHGRVVLLAGEAGCGKSSLAAVLREHIQASGKPHKFAQAACSAQSGRDEAFWPFAEAFAQLTTNKRRKVTEDVLDSLLETAPEWISMVPVAGSILGASLKTAQLIRAKTKTGGELNPERLLREYVDALKTICESTPALIVLDDLHWSDAASIKLLSHLSRNIGELRALVVGAYRPSDIAVDGHALYGLIDDIERYDDNAVITIPPLSEAGVKRLIDASHAPNKFPQTFGPLMFHNTGGSPLFLVESLQLMRAQSEIFKDDGDNKWAIQPQWEDDLPRSVEAVVDERIGRLPEALLDLLTLSAVQGRTFDAAVLAYVLDTDEVQVMKQLEPAERVHGLINYVGDIELDNDITARYALSSSLFHRALSARLRGKQKMMVYRKTAIGIDQLWPDDNEDLAARLSELYAVGKVPDRAAFFGVVAARKCRKAGQISNAIQLLEDAEKMHVRSGVQNSALQAEIDEQLGHLYEIDASYDRSAERTQRAAAPGVDVLGWRAWASLQTRLARLADHDGRFNDSLSIIEAARAALPDDSPDKYSVEAAQVSTEYTRALVRVSRADEALAHCEEALARTTSIAEPARREIARVNLRGAQAMALYFNGQYDRCLRAAEETLPIATKLGMLTTVRGLLTSLVNWCITVGEYPRARRHVGEMLKLALETSDESLRALSHLLDGKMLTLTGQHAKALEHYALAEGLVLQFKSFAWEPELLALKAWSLIDQGAHDAARPLLQRAAVLARRSGSREWVGYVQLTQARFELLTGQPEAALAHAETAQQIFTEESARYDQARSERVIARCHRALGQHEKASNSFQTAWRMFELLGNQQQLERTEQQRDGK